MPGRPFDPKLSQRVIAAFFAERHAPGDKFWTVREIAHRFDVSRYAADAVVLDLMAKRLLVGHGRTGTYVADSKAVTRGEGQPRVGLVLPPLPPLPVREPNWWYAELRRRTEARCRQSRWVSTVFERFDEHEGSSFLAQFAAAQCRCAIVFSPPPTAIPTLTRLRAQRIPMVSMGHVPTGAEKLDIPVVEGDDREAIRSLVLQLRDRGLKRIAMVGLSDPQVGTDRLRGFVDALDQYDHAYPADMIIESLDMDYVIASLRHRLSAPKPPQAVIFQNYTILYHALRDVPKLAPAIKNGMVGAVVDEYGVRRLWPDLPLAYLMVDPVKQADTAVAVLTSLLRHEPVKPLTLLRYPIRWP